MKSSRFCEVARSWLRNSQPGLPGKASRFCDVTYLIWLALTEYLLCAQCWVNIDRTLPWLNDLLSSVTWRWTTDLLNAVAITTFDFCNTSYRQKKIEKANTPEPLHIEHLQRILFHLNLASFLWVTIIFLLPDEDTQTQRRWLISPSTYKQWGPEPADNPSNLAQEPMNFTAVP